ncbi:MAG: glycosyltransferase [Dokdonella sp.]
MRGAALIVLAWNKWPLTRRCLDALLASELAAAEVIVVDNGSTDETPTELVAYADRVRIVRLPENLGFVRGMNAGMAAARADDDVVLLNNDLLFTQVDWLGRLRDAAYAAPENGIVGCRLLGPEVEGRLYHAGGFIEADDLWGQQTESGRVERDVGQFSTTRRAQGIAFALAYLRRDCLDRIGPLDTAFHSYFEDTDYCLRAADAGIASVVAGAVTLRHDQHGSTEDDGGFRQRLWQESRATFAARWHERLRADYRGNVLWQGATRFPCAYAHLARLLVRRLDARGLRMAYQAVEREVASVEDFRLDLATRRRWPGPADAALVCAPGDQFAQAQGCRRIGLGFSEWERVPTAWVEASRRLDRLLVPDAFQQEAFRAAGVQAPIEIMPLGVDGNYCHPHVPTLRNPRENFVFLAVADELVRDAPDVLLAAFRRSFHADEAVELLIHVRPGRDALSIAQALAPLKQGDVRVHVLTGWAFPWHQRAQLMAAADAYVSVRRGGGWDPFAAEALACAKILIAADFGSQAALAREQGVLVAATRVDDPRRPGLRWAEPDRDALAAQLRKVFEQRTHLIAQAHARAGTFARTHDIDGSADLLAELVTCDARLAPPRVPPAPHRPVQLSRPASGQIVVLGMHRSGTSSVAGLLARMGVSVGPERDLLRGPDNPKGHYESGRLHMACVRRLAAAGGDWCNPPKQAPAAAIDAFRHEVGVLIDEFDTRRPWLIKEPRLCLVVRELLPLLTRPLFVHVVRKPHEVVDSLVARNELDPAAGLALWEHYTRAAFDASRGWPRVLIDYAELIADPHTVAHQLGEALRAAGVEGIADLDAKVVQDWVEPSPPRARAHSPALSDAQRALQAAIADRTILDETPIFATVHGTPLVREAG